MIDKTMVLFWGGEYSNFFPCFFDLKDHQWHNSEQYFMWCKAVYFEDYVIAQKIKEEHDPATCKWLGRHVNFFDSEKWMTVCEQYMYEGCYAKFSQNEGLKKLILSTGDKILVEASPYDKIWGIGLGENNPDAYDQTKWEGLNLLGKTLMKVREVLRKC